MNIFLDEITFDEPTWVIIADGYLYMAPTIEELKRIIDEEWMHDKHLVG